VVGEQRVSVVWLDGGKCHVSVNTRATILDAILSSPTPTIRPPTTTVVDLPPDSFEGRELEEPPDGLGEASTGEGIEDVEDGWSSTPAPVEVSSTPPFPGPVCSAEELFGWVDALPGLEVCVFLIRVIAASRAS